MAWFKRKNPSTYTIKNIKHEQLSRDHYEIYRSLYVLKNAVLQSAKKTSVDSTVYSSMAWLILTGLMRSVTVQLVLGSLQDAGQPFQKQNKTDSDRYCSALLKSDELSTWLPVADKRLPALNLSGELLRAIDYVSFKATYYMDPIYYDPKFFKLREDNLVFTTMTIYTPYFLLFEFIEHAFKKATAEISIKPQPELVRAYLALAELCFNAKTFIVQASRLDVRSEYMKVFGASLVVALAALATLLSVPAAAPVTLVLGGSAVAFAFALTFATPILGGILHSAHLRIKRRLSASNYKSLYENYSSKQAAIFNEYGSAIESLLPENPVLSVGGHAILPSPQANAIEKSQTLEAPPPVKYKVSNAISSLSTLFIGFTPWNIRPQFHDTNKLDPKWVQEQELMAVGYPKGSRRVLVESGGLRNKKNMIEKVVNDKALWPNWTKGGDPYKLRDPLEMAKPIVPEIKAC